MKKNLLVAILKKYGIRRAEIFGSVARGEANDDSDLDLLVEFPEDMSLLKRGRLQFELEDRLGVKVDLVNRRMIKPILKPYVMKDVMRVM